MSEILSPIERLSFSRLDKIMDMPDLVEIQTKSYKDFCRSISQKMKEKR